MAGAVTVARTVALEDNLDFLLEVIPPRPELDVIKVKKSKREGVSFVSCISSPPRSGEPQA